MGILPELDSRRGQESYVRPLAWTVAALALAGMAVRLAFEVERLLLVPGGPIDFLIYRGTIRDWFAGVPVYVGTRAAVHPPATYLLQWPIYGWGSRVLSLWWYAGTTVLAAGLFARLLVREARPEGALDRTILVALIVASYPAAVTIGNGQVTFHVLLAALAGVLLQCREAPGVRRDAALTALFLFALVKPHLTLPFFWVVAFTSGWVRPAALAVVAYLAATGAAIALHGAGLDAVRALLAAWIGKSTAGATMSGYGNLHIWLAELGLETWILRASALAFAIHGLWSWRHRQADLWVRLGVAAIVARLWAYHRVYDDLLLIFPLIALYRLARRDPPDRVAGVLFVLGAAALAAPITPILETASWALVAVWLAQLGYLGWTARSESRAARPRRATAA